jgi:3-deoxy-D-arabino-heptulosonate 7-phosphate (DAHP) synthase
VAVVRCRSEDDVKSLKKRCVEERKKLIEEAGIARITSVVDHLRQLESQQQFADFVRKGGRYTLEEADLHSKKKPVEFVPAESSSAP